MSKVLMEFDTNTLDGRWEFDAAQHAIQYKNAIMAMARTLKAKADKDPSAKALLETMDRLAQEYKLPEVREVTRGAS